MKKDVDLKAIRTAIADYLSSEGCGCCERENHSNHLAVIGKLLNVPMYEDKSGYDFKKYRTKPDTEVTK